MKLGENKMMGKSKHCIQPTGLKITKPPKIVQENEITITQKIQYSYVSFMIIENTKTAIFYM